ncbi:hypothetical protein C448_09123, partial [Halococcus morrhuae DSM 1307]
YCKFLVKTVDDKIKQVLFLYLVVCLGLVHIFLKQMLALTQCDRLKLEGWWQRVVRNGMASRAETSAGARRLRLCPLFENEGGTRTQP